MKKDIHPEYYSNTKVICACSNSFITGSTQKEIKTDLCSVCHPFFTGKQKLVDTARRVEKFEARIKAQKEIAPTKKGKKVKRAAKKAAKIEKEIKVEKKSTKKPVKKVAKKTVKK